MPSRHDVSLYTALIEHLVAFQGGIDVYQHGFQRRRREPAQAIAEHVVAKGTRRADPVLEGGVRDFRFQLLEAVQAENESMKGGPEDRRGRNLGCDAGVGQGGHRRAEWKTLLR